MNFMRFAEASQTLIDALSLNMTKTNARAIVLFARAPVLGQVKTRLHPFLDPESILRLYTCFLNDSIRKISGVKSADPFIGVYPSDSSGYFSRLQEFPVQVFVQDGKDLGERLSNAFQERFNEGYERVAVIGSDSPSLPIAVIEQALSSEKDFTIGPSVDGGYYLIGMAGRKPVGVFEGVSWGSDKVLAQTLERVGKSGCSLELLPPWYDVDRPEDLKFLKTHLEWIERSGGGVAGATGEFLQGLNIE